MLRKIGIFDPGFSTIGHYIPFNRYIAELVGDDFEVVFLDIGGRMKEAYEGKLALAHAPRFVTVAEPPVYPGKLTLRAFVSVGWWMRRWNDFRWIARTFKNIEKAGMDLVIISSQTNPFIFLQRPRFAYCTVIQYPMLVESRARLKGLRLLFAPMYDFMICNYRAFLRGANVVFTTNDPTMPSPFPGAVWLPTNLDLRGSAVALPVAKRKFMTIGVVSGAKNHDFALDVFEKFDLPYSYLIVGMPTDEVGEKVKERVEHFPKKNVSGLFKNIPAEEYEGLIGDTDYLILPYDFRMQTRGASQVLYDAFRNRTPIITPDIEPFRGYVARYGVGFMYKEGNEVAFRDALQKAAGRSKADFADNFSRLYRDYSFEKIKKDFSDRIRACFMV